MKTMIRFWFVTASIFICTNLSLAQWVQTNVPYGGSKECIALCGSNLFVGTGSDGVFRSTDKGASWTQTSLTRGVVSALTVFPNGAGGSNILAGKCCNEGFYISIDSGAGWSAVNTVIPSYTVVYAFAVSPNGVGGSNLFAATDRGVFISTDNGTSWTAKNNGLPNASVMSLAVSGTNLFAGTGG